MKTKNNCDTYLQNNNYVIKATNLSQFMFYYYESYFAFQDHCLVLQLLNKNVMKIIAASERVTILIVTVFNFAE